MCVHTCVCAHACVLAGAVCMWMGGLRHHMAFFDHFPFCVLMQSLSWTLKFIHLARLPGASDPLVYRIPAPVGVISTHHRTFLHVLEIWTQVSICLGHFPGPAALSYKVRLSGFSFQWAVCFVLYLHFDGWFLFLLICVYSFYIRGIGLFVVWLANIFPQLGICCFDCLADLTIRNIFMQLFHLWLPGPLIYLSFKMALQFLDCTRRIFPGFVQGVEELNI